MCTEWALESLLDSGTLPLKLHTQKAPPVSLHACYYGHAHYKTRLKLATVYSWPGWLTIESIHDIVQYYSTSTFFLFPTLLYF